LGCFLISADWVGEADEKLVRQVLQPQIDFYTKLVKSEKLEFVFEETGSFSEEVVAKNKAMLQKVGIFPKE
jgi:hypothetical protein